MTGDHDIADNPGGDPPARPRRLIPGLAPDRHRRRRPPDAGWSNPKEIADLIADFVKKGR